MGGGSVTSAPGEIGGNGDAVATACPDRDPIEIRTQVHRELAGIARPHVRLGGRLEALPRSYRHAPTRSIVQAIATAEIAGTAWTHRGCRCSRRKGAVRRPRAGRPRRPG